MVNIGKIIKVLATVLVLLLIMSIPFPKGVADDGGTKVYAAVFYKIVNWNRPVYDTVYKKTSVYKFPENFKSLDELWEIESKEIFPDGYETGYGDETYEKPWEETTDK